MTLLTLRDQSDMNIHVIWVVPRRYRLRPIGGAVFFYAIIG